MFKYIFIFSIIVSNLFAQSIMKDKYLQILAKNIETKNDIVDATGDLVVYSKNYYITANRLKYNKKDGILELFDDVNIVNNDETTSYSQYLFIDVKNEIKNIKPLLLINNKSKLWFNAKDAKATKDNYTLDTTTLSSCDCKNPVWSIGFTEGDYSTTNQWINTYNTTLYINTVPVLYTPYFGFPTDDTRRTGLLKPSIGLSNNEGILYAQPIYYAPSLNYDFEYIPQIRTIRGMGHALKYRYKDSIYSNLKFEIGLFNESTNYRKKRKLVNKRHYGWDFEYKRSNIFANYFNAKEHSDGLIVKSLDMNDVDYINTKYDTKISDYTNKFLESKIKYYYNTNNYYSDIDIRLYNDISKDNNDDVMQNKPAIKLHKYATNLYFDNLTTSVNFDYLRKTRKIGFGVNRTDITLPISYYSYLFNDYLNLSFGEKFSFTNLQYTNNQDDNFQDGRYSTNTHFLSVYTDLLKVYDTTAHNIKLSVDYEKPNNIIQKGDIYGITNSNVKLEKFLVSKPNETIKLSLNQSFINTATLKDIVKHRLIQQYIYDESKQKFINSDLTNDISYFYDYGKISNRIVYNHKVKRITSSSTTLDFKNDGYFAGATYTDARSSTTGDATSRTLKYNFGIDFYKHYKVKYNEEYDLVDDISKKKTYSLNIDKKCWAVNFEFADSYVATNTTDNSVLRQNILYIKFTLKQLFAINQTYKFKE